MSDQPMKWAELRGSCPDLTGDLTTAQYLEEVHVGERRAAEIRAMEANLADVRALLEDETPKAPYAELKVELALELLDRADGAR